MQTVRKFSSTQIDSIIRSLASKQAGEKVVLKFNDYIDSERARVSLYRAKQKLGVDCTISRRDGTVGYVIIIEKKNPALTNYNDLEAFEIDKEGNVVRRVISPTQAAIEARSHVCDPLTEIDLGAGCETEAQRIRRLMEADGVPEEEILSVLKDMENKTKQEEGEFNNENQERDCGN